MSASVIVILAWKEQLSSGSVVFGDRSKAKEMLVVY